LLSALRYITSDLDVPGLRFGGTWPSTFSLLWLLPSQW